MTEGKSGEGKVGTAPARAALPRYAQRLFDRRVSAHDPALHGSTSELLAALKKHGLPAHDAVLRFDETFGGLLLRSEAVDDWRETGMYALVGAHACLASQGSRFPQKGLVPVMYDSNGGVEYLDAEGKAYVLDEIEEVLTPFAADGPTMLAAILAYDLLEGHGEPWKGFERRAGQLGESLATSLGLTRVPLLGTAQLWVSDDAVVFSRDWTQMAAWTDEAWTRMQEVLARTRRPAAELFAELGRAKQPLAPAYAALVSEIAAVSTFAEVETLFRPYSSIREVLSSVLVLANGTWSQPEAIDDGQRAISTALMKQVRSMAEGDSALTLGWIARHGAGEWPEIRGWFDVERRRAAWCDALEGEMPTLGAWMKDASASRRTSAAFALGWCVRAAEPEADALLSAVATEKDANARGTELLALAAIAKRSGQRLAETRAILAAEKPKPGSFHAVATIVARVFLDEPIAAAEAEVLLAQLRRAAKVPPEWAWKPADSPCKCDSLANEAMSRMTLADPAPVIASLLAALRDPKLTKRAAEVKDALAHAAFAGSGRVAPREGIALEDLSGDEVKILEALVASNPGPLKVLGLNGSAFPDMLAETPPLWQLLDVTVNGKKHRWHFERVVAEVVFGRLTPEEARDAVLAAFTPEDAATVASSWSNPRMALLENLSSEEERGRIVRTCLLVLSAAKEKGVDVDALCVGTDKRPLAEEGILALWSLAVHEEAPPREHFALYRRALARPEWPEALREALAKVPEAVRTEIEANRA